MNYRVSLAVRRRRLRDRHGILRPLELCREGVFGERPCEDDTDQPARRGVALVGIESLIGSAEDDTLSGSGVSNELVGAADETFGLGGGDTSLRAAIKPKFVAGCRMNG